MPINKSQEDFRELSYKILGVSNQGIPRIDFITDISKLLLNFSGCDKVELWLKKARNFIHTSYGGSERFSFINDAVINNQELNLENIKESWETLLNNLRNSVINVLFDLDDTMFTPNGSFFTGNFTFYFTSLKYAPDQTDHFSDQFKHVYKSIAIIPIQSNNKIIGLMQLSCKKADYLIKPAIVQFEEIAQIIGIALLNQSTHSALQERVKELTCLYGMTQLSENPDESIDSFIQSIVDLIPPAWQYPEMTAGRIILDDKVYNTEQFNDNWQKQSSEIIVNGKIRGAVEVAYKEEKPDLDEGPFLNEERSLVNAISRQVALIVEQKETEKDRMKLQEQLRHADRLTIIGQLAAGIAHELNEPLGNILGFAQLSKKNIEENTSVYNDIEKIISASLHAREVIKKLLVLSRETPPKKTEVDINQVVTDGLYFFEARCAKLGINLIRYLSPDLPLITGDSSQINQVLVNLVVNSIQAMPNGGELKISTQSDEKDVSLIVEDSGPGMSEEVKSKIFLPFFTTKDVNEGTGLGLAVVMGIVTSNNGTIQVISNPREGARFIIKFPIIVRD